MKHELLVPAGNVECLKQAIANGADAVYIGCKDYSARKFADNFTNEELIEAIKLCHLYGVKIYVTMNTLVKDNEVPLYLGQVEFLYKNGVDALLIQDFGMICLVREKYPELEIHASVQANTSSKETAELFYNLGVKRAVFSRELSLAEINNINVPIEKEVFIHGALCVSYSGCCLMSSMLGGRSGNRGECAGCCRMSYTLKHGMRVLKENKYLLSTKELNTASKFKELLDSNITSFKIEGRMKSPEYVGFVTKYYRSLIDNYCTNINLEEETNKLKTLYNRGFTVGRLFNCSDQDLMNIDYPNHIGLEIGKVIGVDDKKIKIKLDKPLNQQDGIRFLNSGKGFIVNYLYDLNQNLINTATDICYVDNKVELKENDIVCKTLDYNLMKELQRLPARKIPVTFKVRAYIGEAFSVQISDGTNTIKVSGNIVEQATTAPIDDNRIREQIEKLGDTPFISTSTVIESSKEEFIFINIKEINDIRRTLVEKLIDIRMNLKKKVVIKNIQLQPIVKNIKPGIVVSVNNREQLEVCNKLGAKRIYVSDERLYNEYKMFENVFYKVPRNRLFIEPNLKMKNLVAEYFDFSKKDFLVGDYGLNVSNIYTAYYLYKMNLCPVTLSVELTEDEIINFINSYIKLFNTYPEIEIFGYGKVENMLIKGNILDIKENDKDYTLINNKNEVFPVFFDGVNTHIINCKNLELKNIAILKKYADIRLEFDKEDEKFIGKLFNKFK